MTSVELSVDPTAIAPQRERDNARLGADAAAAFSYAAAIDAATQSAGRALAVHGPGPRGEDAAQLTSNARAAAPNKATPDARSRRAVASPADPGGEVQTPRAAADPVAATPNALRRGADAASVRTSAEPQAAVLQAAPLISPQVKLASPPKTAPPSGLEATAPRSKPIAAARAPSVRAPQASSPVEQFAPILARRLLAERVSRFELRLDPPALGRIEARLDLGADGSSVVRLAFENETAFDLFRRDEAALRASLADAGLDLSAADLAFSFDPSAFADRRATPRADHSLVAAQAPPPAPAASPLAQAGDAGALIDLQI